MLAQLRVFIRPLTLVRSITRTAFQSRESYGAVFLFFNKLLGILALKGAVREGGATPKPANIVKTEGGNEILVGDRLFGFGGLRRRRLACAPSGCGNESGGGHSEKPEELVRQAK